MKSVNRKSVKSPGYPPGTRTMAVFGTGALVLYSARVLINLFGTSLPYSMAECPGNSTEDPQFLRFLSTVTAAPVCRSQIRRLKNGPSFYPEQVDAIRSARHSINMEFYEFKTGEVAEVFVDALTERARKGVDVRVVLDAIGSFTTHRSYFDKLLAAGGQMHWYHPLRWNTWQHANNRSHRKILVIDDHTAFVGGAGVADHWMQDTARGPRWRDDVFRVEGEAIAGLIATFSENWLESTGEILTGNNQFNFPSPAKGKPALVVSSTPTGGGTHARILFQALLKSARKSISVTTPYFLPDHSARRALMEASERGVRVRILAAGPHIDHPMVRRLSRHNSRHLLKAGAEIFEYQPSMIHAKLMVIDDSWCVFGSTNFDHRSFALNDEVNIATLDRELAAVMNEDFSKDLQQSRRLTLKMLESRGLTGEAELAAGDLLQRES